MGGLALNIGKHLFSNFHQNGAESQANSTLALQADRFQSKYLFLIFIGSEMKGAITAISKAIMQENASQEGTFLLY